MSKQRRDSITDAERISSFVKKELVTCILLGKQVRMEKSFLGSLELCFFGGKHES